MKNLLVKLINFLKGHNIWKYITFLVIYLLGFSIVVVHLAGDVKSNIIGTVIGIVVSGMFLYFAKICVGYVEDIAKVTDDTNKLKQIYPCARYAKQVHLNGSKCEIIYNEVIDGDNYDFKVVDNPQKQYEIPSFVDQNFLELLKAHDNSYIKNDDTVRLDDVLIEEDKCTLYLSRSTYFNHLVTNRAMDFYFEGTTVRSVLEYGPTINSFKDSKMSNHIGVNALVFLSDGTILVPRRKNDATISKNQITSSIATRLGFPSVEQGIDEQPKKSSEQEITKEYFFHDNVVDSLTSRLKIPKEEVKNLDMTIKFIGLGQNIYEGGKPQTYFAIKINNLNKEDYYKLQQNVSQVGKIDVDKCTYLADYSSMQFVKNNKIAFNYFDVKSRKTKKIALYYEKSFACNIWHFEHNECKGQMID